MAFFDEIGKKISHTSQKAVQKTRDMADVAKLNSNISDEEKKINDTYYQIGQLYVSLHSDDCEMDFEPLINQLNKSVNNVETLKRQIQDIKGVKRCVSCGAEIPNNAMFCSSCGTPVAKPKEVAATDITKCENCGNMIEKGMKFCTFCGSPAIEKVKNVCSVCGAELIDGNAFCTNCGNKIPNEEAQKIIQVPETTQIYTPNTDFSDNGNLLDNEVRASEQIGQTSELTNEIIPERKEETDAAATEKVCSNCGTPIDKDAAFCTQCGSRID